MSQIEKHFGEGLLVPENLSALDYDLLDLAKVSFDEIGADIAAARFRDGLRAILKLVDAVNKYLNDTAPWKKIKENKAEAGKALFVSAHVLKCLAILIEPYLPIASEKSKEMLNINSNSWQYPELAEIKVKNVILLYNRIEQAQIDEFLAVKKKE